MESNDNLEKNHLWKSIVNTGGATISEKPSSKEVGSSMVGSKKKFTNSSAVQLSTNERNLSI